MITIVNIRKSIVTIIIAVAMVLISLSGVLAAVVDFSEFDDNPYSPRSGQNVSPYDATNAGTVTMWYHQYNEY